MVRSAESQFDSAAVRRRRPQKAADRNSESALQAIPRGPHQNAADRNSGSALQAIPRGPHQNAADRNSESALQNLLPLQWLKMNSRPVNIAQVKSSIASSFASALFSFGAASSIFAAADRSSLEGYRLKAAR